MKRLGRVMGNLLAMALAVVTLQAMAETQLGGRDFNHMTTGFPLAGGHATAACETCHVGGVFKGTPKNCDGCHALGKRIVATPKPVNHIPTEAACETCHFNTSSWLGARFNHGTAKPSQCATCHNGRIAAGKHGRHIATIHSCDQCHRTTSWIPASWNHTGSVYGAADCKDCHLNNVYGVQGRGYTTTAKHTTFVNSIGIANCRSCHTNFYTFYSHYYLHDKPFTTCGECHYNPAYTTANGVTQMVTGAGTIHGAASNATVGIITGTGLASTGCNSCHVNNYSSWAGSMYRHNDAAYATAMGTGSCQQCHTAANAPIRPIPQNHLNAFNAGLVATPTNCQACHTSTGTWAQMNHGALTAGGQPCKTCHDSGLNPNLYFANMQKKRNGHEGYNSATQDCTACHGLNYSSWHK